MENWYSKEFISSSQTAARLVFNINNCVDLSKVLQLRPNRPPDAKGRESFVYIMDGAVVRSIKDLPIDELTPWNSKKCKSSTRFSSVQFDAEKNSLVFNRYIISDAANVERPECLIACYYCKHPIFNLVKKIYYACDSNRERCLPGTFVIFIYEFAHAEFLYRTYGAYRISANNSMASSHSQQHQHLSPAISSHSHNQSQPVIQQQHHHHQQQQQQSNNTNTIQRYFENVPLKMEDFIMDETGAMPTEDSYEFDTYLQGTPNASCLEDILEACNSASLKRTQETAFSNDSMALLPQLKRVKRSNSEQPDPENGVTSPKSGGCVSSANESSTHFRQFFTTEGLLENFRKNCLCVREELAQLLDKLDDQFVVKDEQQLVKNEQEPSNEEEVSDGNAITEGKEAVIGGCLLVDSPFLAENLYFTVLWFRNGTFLDSNNCPLIHPVAALISSRVQPDDQQFLVNRFSSEISADDSKGICRSVLSSDCDDFDSVSSTASPLFAYPCVRLIPIGQIKQILHDKITSLNEEEFQCKVEGDLFRSEDGLLNSLLSFEHFARKLRIVERGWPSGFRMWFREKSGWIYERCSLVARIKAGFAQNDAHFDMSEALAPLKETLLQNLSATLEDFCDCDPNSALQNAISTTEQVFTDLLIRAVHSVISSSSDQPTDSYSVRLHPSKAHFWIGSSQWAQLSAQERRECLSNLGLSALSAAGTLSANSFDPLIFSGLSRSQKMDLLSRANALDVLNLTDNVQKKRFVVEDSAGQCAFYVCNESKSVQCQCHSNDQSFHLCEHILAIVLKDNCFARKVSEIISQNRGRTANSATMVNGLQLDSSPVVEIICCSSNGSNT
ncbi:hypothetical protein niasHS_007330 [Heterodera schachtii]|uniref:SWIM-type domain-containing protein n=1 Tax=Heterodera schachtii TaxID=97005 RepID=A0ABD2JK72_HETSC